MTLRFRAHRWFILTVYFCISSAVAADLDFGGPRQVRATVSRDSSGILCSVSFAPVSCFDVSLNRSVNQQKARDYAVIAMARAAGLRENTAAALSATNLRSVDGATDRGGRFQCSYRADSVTVSATDGATRRIHSGPDSPKDSQQPESRPAVGPEPDLLTCLDDLRATLGALEAEFSGRIGGIRSVDGRELDDSTAVLENGAIEALARFEREVGEQRLLLEVERSELLRETADFRQSFLEDLAGAYRARRENL